MSLLLSSCANISHLSQSVSGQISLWNEKVPIESLLKQPLMNDVYGFDTPLLELSKRQRLHYINKVLNFAYQELSLPNNGSYRHFVELNQPYVVYNVVVAEPYALKPKRSCYPIIGCQSYRGYFKKTSAIDYANKIKSKGYDVRVGGVSAYSTLGWFKDPVYSSFFNYDNLELASLIFHELSHQIMYINDDTTFNESFATAVEIYGTKKWLAFNDKNNSSIGYTKAQYQIKRQWDTRVIALIKDYQRQFKELFNDPKHLPDEVRNELINKDNDSIIVELKKHKQALFNQLMVDYRILKEAHSHTNDWDNWFNRDLNNADLISVGDYYGLVDVFNEAISQCQYDLSRFYNFVKQLSKHTYNSRREVLMSEHMCKL